MAWRKVFMIAGTIVAAEVVVVVVVALVVVYAGAFNVAATQPDPPGLDWVLSTTMDNSVRHHAAGLPVSPTYQSPDLAEGYEHFNEMCVTCHGAPGVGRGRVLQGLNPEAPDLSEAAGDWSPSELFWIVKNGVKMSGMPAFGPTHSDEKIWNITAFVKGLPEMTPAQYAAMAKAKAEGGGKEEEPPDSD